MESWSLTLFILLVENTGNENKLENNIFVFFPTSEEVNLFCVLIFRFGCVISPILLASVIFLLLLFVEFSYLLNCFSPHLLFRALFKSCFTCDKNTNICPQIALLLSEVCFLSHLLWAHTSESRCHVCYRIVYAAGSKMFALFGENNCTFRPHHCSSMSISFEHNGKG